ECCRAKYKGAAPGLLFATAVNPVRDEFRHSWQKAGRHEFEHLQAEYDHDDTCGDDEDAIRLWGQGERRSKHANGRAQRRIGNEPPCMEKEMRLEALRLVQIRSGRVVSGCDGN